ncbi:hypothetical protein [Pseudomonas viridiflava]|uniref:hypothetical protein n=1 Tax=Pseudomonas viridiflava TaxID=33069 RepID=UPI000F01E265|nr:hypothetical protein [Pseudomonas viridiflava]QVI86996.1 hypothetical protein KHW14_06510 [Pseudomonas viridiflava]
MQKKKGTNWKFVLGAVLVVAIGRQMFLPPSPSAAHAPATAPVALKQYVKLDGTIDPRKDDLDELCKDHVYYTSKTYKYGREGKTKELIEARVELDKNNIWLSAYAHADVSAVCAKYDTPENQAKYMR